MTGRIAKLSVAAIAIVMLAGACSSNDESDDSAIGADPVGSVVDGSDGATTTDDALSVEAEAVPTDDLGIFEEYALWSATEFGPLAPDPQTLGAGWGSFYAETIAEQIIFDPADDPDQACGLVAPVVARDGFYSEQGYGENLDDLAVIASRGTPEQMQALYIEFRTLFECPVDNGTIEVVAPPDVAGALDSFRFVSIDDAGQQQEGILILRDDLVISIDLFLPEGAAAIDLGALTVSMLAAYDQRTP